MLDGCRDSRFTLAALGWAPKAASAFHGRAQATADSCEVLRERYLGTLTRIGPVKSAATNPPWFVAPRSLTA